MRPPYDENHLSRAPVSGVRTGYRLGGVLKRDCISCEPDSQSLPFTGWLFGQIMTSVQPPSSAHFAAGGFLSFAAGCFF